jgi:hypothetical protein
VEGVDELFSAVARVERVVLNALKRLAGKPLDKLWALSSSNGPLHLES